MLTHNIHGPRLLEENLLSLIILVYAALIHPLCCMLVSLQSLNQSKEWHVNGILPRDFNSGYFFFFNKVFSLYSFLIHGLK
jgi:hypothetical protein